MSMKPQWAGEPVTGWPRRLLGRRGSTVHNAPSRAALREEADELGIDGLDAISAALASPLSRGGGRNGAISPTDRLRSASGTELLSAQRRRAAAVDQEVRSGPRGAPCALGQEDSGDRSASGVRARRCPARRTCSMPAHAVDGSKDIRPRGTRLPSDPEWDEEGLRMEIVR